MSDENNTEEIEKIIEGATVVLDPQTHDLEAIERQSAQARETHTPNFAPVSVLQQRNGRAKCVSFHPTFPYVLVSYHSSHVEMWDYKSKELVHDYIDDSNKAPIRSVCFHPTLPIFATGHDDFTVRITNYVEHKLTAVLDGHRDYVRRVRFHPSKPWLLSCGDDMDARLWNYETSRCLCVLPGHQHYVMDAVFQSMNGSEWVLTCSLDLSIRIFNITGLKDIASESDMAKGPFVLRNTTRLRGEQQLPGFIEPDLSDPPISAVWSAVKERFASFLGSEKGSVASAVVGRHERGICNMALSADNATLLSGGDDRRFIVWSMDERGRYNPTFIDRTHTASVSSVAFAPQRYCFSASEDGTARVYNAENRYEVIYVFPRTETRARLWHVACHPTQSILALVSDEGFQLFEF